MSEAFLSDPPLTAAPARRKESVDPALLQAALKNIRASAEGNGIKPAAILLDGFDGEVVSFEGWMIFRLRSQTKEKRVNGRVNGEIVGSTEDIRNRIKAVSAQAAASPDIVRQTIAALKKRPDKGFGAKKMVVALESLRHDFVIQEPCKPCNGQGQTACKNCQGTGRTYCAKCHGNRDVLCPGCHGTQVMMTAQGHVPCMRCNGAGKIGCDMCQQAGAVLCRICRGGGGIQCQNCAATGWHSQITSLEMRAEGRFDYDRAALPSGLPAVIDALGGRTASARHADVKLREDGIRYTAPGMKPEEYIVMYDTRVPWGTLRFRLGKAVLPAQLFGFTAQLRGMQPFLEKGAAAGIRALDIAAQSPAQTVGKLREALRYRIISETALGIIRQGNRKTYENLQHRYPAGISHDTLRRVVRDMDRALRQVTKAPRLTGLGLSLMAVTLAYMLYFVTPGRMALEKITGLPLITDACDMVLLAGGLHAVGAGIRHAGMRGIDRAVGKLMPPGRRSRLMPRKNGYYVWAGYAGVIAAYLIALLLAGTGAPSWFIAPRHALGL